ncbi:MAG: carboxypeptidase-like regulatory domain-containing protein [Saonia sp.]
MKKSFLFCSLLFTTLLFSQQQGAIRGSISDKEMNNEPLLYANVHVKNTTKSTQTNFHGNFEIPDIDPGNYTLVISYLGYESLEVPVSVAENGVTEIYQGLNAKSISLSEIPLSDTEAKALVGTNTQREIGSSRQK